MALITIFRDGPGLVEGMQHGTTLAASLEWLVGLLLVASFVALGYNLAQAA